MTLRARAVRARSKRPAAPSTRSCWRCRPPQLRPAAWPLAARRGCWPQNWPPTLGGAAQERLADLQRKSRERRKEMEEEHAAKVAELNAEAERLREEAAARRGSRHALLK